MGQFWDAAPRLPAIAGAPGPRSRAVFEFLGYGVATGLALAVDWGFLILLTDRLGLPYPLSAAIGFCLGAGVAYAVCVQLAFRSRPIDDHRSTFAAFFLIGILGLLLTIVLLPLIVALTGLNYALAKGPTACLVFGFNFALRRALLFSDKGFPTLDALWNRISRHPGAGSLFWSIAGLLSAASIWMLSRLYSGISGDGLLYIGRGLADLDPNGVGRDLMFVFDGQSAYSIFGRVIDPLIAGLGFSGASILVSAIGLASWFVAMMFFARSLARGVSAWAIVVFIAVLPNAYAGFNCLHYGEALAIPRPVATALVIGAMVALASRRFVWCAACLCLSSLVHPIVGLTGIAMVMVFLCLENRRWLIVPALGMVGMVTGALLHLPLAKNLFVLVDPAWRHVLDLHCPYLFPRFWPVDYWNRALIQTATTIIAVSLVPRRIGLVLAASVMLSWGGVAVTLLFGDWLPSLLITQLQPWRTGWLLAVGGNASLALVLVRLCQQQATQRLTAAILVIAWAMPLGVSIGFVPALMALALHVHGSRGNLPVRPIVEKAAWAIAAAVACLAILPLMRVLIALWQSKPAEASMSFGLFWSLVPQVTLTCVGAVVLALWHRRLDGVPARILGGLVCLGLFVGAVRVWDDRNGAQRAIETIGRPADLNAIIAKSPGEVLWLKGFSGEAWMLTGRPNWATELQAAGTVFSRPLSLQWYERTSRLVALNLADRTLQDPFRTTAMNAALPVVTKDKVDRFCAAADAPAWIVAPLEKGTSPAADLDARVWHAPYVSWTPVPLADGGLGWRGIDSFALIGCAAKTSRMAAR